MRERFVPLLVALSLLAGCQKFVEGKQMFRELMTLREQIATEFHERAVDINVMNGTRMTVKFVNSPFNAKSQQEKQQRADAIGAFVLAHYKRPVTAVNVVFTSQSGAAGFNMTSSEMFKAQTQPANNASSTR